MSDATWWVDEHGNRRFKTRRSVKRLHPEWREESRVLAAKKSSASAESAAEQAETDKQAREGDKKRS